MMKFSPLQKMALTAMMLVISILATRVTGIYVTPYVRLSAGVAITMFSSILLGPISGALIGGCGDILGILIVNTSGVAINPLITITFTLMGATPGLLMMLFKKFNNKKISMILFDTFLLFIFLSLLILSITNNEVTMFRQTFHFNIVAKILIPTIGFIVLAAIHFFVYYFDKYFSKHNKLDERIPNVYQIAFIVIFVEVVFTLLINSGAKWIFYNLMLGQNLPFVLIFLPALFLAFIYIPGNTILVSYLCLLASKTIKVR